MRCFSCINTTRRRFAFEDEGLFDSYSPTYSDSSEGRRQSTSDSAEQHRAEPHRAPVCLDDNQKVTARISATEARSFSFRELAVATKNFKDSHLIGEGGFGKVYKGRLDNGMVIATKRLNLEGLQGNQEFIIEVLMLSLLHHPNLVNLIGYSAEGDQRLLVYEYMPKGSLADHLFDIEHDRDVLDWNTRVKIAAGAAKGLEYLHCVANPPVIYRDLKSANILLDSEFNPKLSDFGLAKLGPVGDDTHVSTRVMGTYGYCAPEYALSGKLTMKSDIFSFGVVLLEIITGRKAYDLTQKPGAQSLIAWSRPFLRDKAKHTELVDPRLRQRFPIRSARHLVTVTNLCLNEVSGLRPSITDIVEALNYLVSESQSPSSSAAHTPTGSSPLKHQQGHTFSPKQLYR